MQKISLSYDVNDPVTQSQNPYNFQDLVMLKLGGLDELCGFWLGLLTNSDVRPILIWSKHGH